MATTEIPLRPEIPERLRVAARQGIIVPFVGAGVSQLGGCPRWDAFANAALDFFRRPGMLDHAQFDQLSQLRSRTKLSVAIGLEEEYKLQIDFKAILKPDPNREALGHEIYGHLGQLAKTFITTNYDDWFEKPPPPGKLAVDAAGARAKDVEPIVRRTPLYSFRDFTENALATPHNVLHIHGSILDRKSMVLTTSEYLRRYASHGLVGKAFEENSYLTFLEHLFRTRCVLFIGYGLDEMEILEYILQKSRTVEPEPSLTAPREEPNHFLLQGFYSHEAALMRSFRQYYLRECNVALLPYSKDARGWEQLIDVVQYLSSEIPIGGLLPSQKRLAMEALLT